MKSLANFAEVNWILEYRVLDYENFVWSRVWDDNGKVLPVQSLEGILAYVKKAKDYRDKKGHVLFHPDYQARISNVITGEIIPGEIFV